jgi:hypothetical protein
MFNIDMMRQSIKTGTKKMKFIITISKKLLHTKVMDKSMTWYNNQITERNEEDGRKHIMKNEWEGNTGKGAFSKKAVAYKKERQKWSIPKNKKT